MQHITIRTLESMKVLRSERAPLQVQIYKLNVILVKRKHANDKKNAKHVII